MGHLSTSNPSYSLSSHFSTPNWAKPHNSPIFFLFPFPLGLVFPLRPILISLNQAQAHVVVFLLCTFDQEHQTEATSMALVPLPLPLVSPSPLHFSIWMCLVRTKLSDILIRQNAQPERAIRDAYDRPETCQTPAASHRYPRTTWSTPSCPTGSPHRPLSHPTSVVLRRLPQRLDGAYPSCRHHLFRRRQDLPVRPLCPSVISRRIPIRQFLAAALFYKMRTGTIQ